MNLSDLATADIVVSARGRRTILNAMTRGAGVWLHDNVSETPERWSGNGVEIDSSALPQAIVDARSAGFKVVAT